MRNAANATGGYPRLLYTESVAVQLMGKKIGTGSNAMLNVISGCATEPDGVSLVDPEQGDTRVANWGGSLAALGDMSGYRLRKRGGVELGGRVRDIARAMLRDVVRAYPEGSATVRTWWR